MRVRFDPTTTGDKSGSVTVTSTAATITIPLSGSGIQTTLDRTPTALDFGTRNVGQPASAAGESTFTNAGTQAIVLSGITLSGTGASQFELLRGGAGVCASALSLAPGDTCKVRARFHPSSAGAKVAVIRVASDAGSDVTVSLAGTATPLARLVLPAFKTRANTTAHKRLRVPVKSVGGTIKSMVFTLKSGGKVVGSAKLRSLSGNGTVTLRLKRSLPPGKYSLSGTGKEPFGHNVSGRGTVTLSAASRRSHAPSGGGGGGWRRERLAGR